VAFYHGLSSGYHSFGGEKEVTALAMVYSLVSRSEDNIEKIVEDFTKDVQTLTNSLLLSASTVSYTLTRECGNTRTIC